MIAIAADYGLKPRRQKARIGRKQRLRAGRADEQVRENPSQPQHPDVEITRGKFDRTILLESAHRHPKQSEHRILWLAFRQKPVYQLYEMTCADGPIIILEKLHRRVQQVGRLNPHEIPVFFFEKLNSGMCQRLQRRAEAVFHLPRAISNASKLSKITAKKRNDPIGLSERVCLQYNRIALMESHT